MTFWPSQGSPPAWGSPSPQVQEAHLVLGGPLDSSGVLGVYMLWFCRFYVDERPEGPPGGGGGGGGRSGSGSVPVLLPQ